MERCGTLRRLAPSLRALGISESAAGEGAQELLKPDESGWSGRHMGDETLGLLRGMMVHHRPASGVLARRGAAALTAPVSFCRLTISHRSRSAEPLV